MAIIDKETLFNTENLNGAKWSFGVPLERTNPVPIDKWSTFKTYDDAVEFVNREKGNIAYPGQMITIEDPDTNIVDVYVVDRTATDCLKKLASGGSADEIAQKLTQLSSQLLSADGIIDQLSGAHDELSDALSAEIVDLSVALSTEIDNLSAALSDEINNLSDALSGEIDNLSTALSNEISSLESKLSSAWQFRGTVDADVDDDNVAKIRAQFADPQSGDVVIVNKKFVDEDGTESTAAIEYAFDGTDWQQLGDESSNVSKYQLKQAIEALSTDLSAEIVDLSVALSTEIDNLSAALSDEISAETKRAEDTEEYLSTAIDSKIFAQFGDDADPVSVDTLTIHKITSDKYAELLAHNEVVSSDIYVVESGEHNVYGEKITNVANGTDATDAATYGQLTATAKALSDEIKLSVETLEEKIENAVEGGVEALSSELLTPTTGIIPVLETKVDTISSNLSDEIEALSDALSGDIDQLSADVYKDLSVAMTTTVGTTDGILSTFTFTQNDKIIGTIDLPKDKVIESAQVVFGTLADDGTFTADVDSEEKVYDTSKYYIEAVIANQTDKVYIPVPELVDTYVGHDGDTVKIEVVTDADGARCLSAEVKDESITMAKLSGTFIFDCGDAFFDM